MPNESQQFLDEFKPTNNDPFAFLEDKPAAPAEDTPPEIPADTPTDPEPKNRRERRLMEKLQGERESAIALAARLEALSESQKSRSEESEFLKVAERIYGNSTPELSEATELLKTVLLGVKDEAKREAIAEYQNLRQQEQQAVANAEKRLDTMLGEIEDEANIDLAPAQRTEFLKLLEKMSPKDSNGNIVEYADHFAVWDIYQEKVKAHTPPNPAKDMAARAMVQGGSADQNVTTDAHERWLRENGII
jgi:hypothetical protein